MTHIKPKQSVWRHPDRFINAGLGVLSLGLGCAFYAGMRPAQFWISWAPRLPHLPAPEMIAASAPSFLHTLAFALIGAAFSHRPRQSVLFWTAVSLAWEALQGLWPALGVCDPSDFACALLGGAVSWVIISGQANTELTRTNIQWIKLPVTIIGAAALIATSKSSVPQYPSIEPIYMSYQDLRAAFRVDPPKPILESGKILLIDKYLLVNDLNKGIHVFDNADPTQPKPIAFLNLPGNIDLASKDHVIYADSFIDLVAIEYADGNFTLTHREEDVFPYDAYQVLLNKGPAKVQYGTFKDIDKKHGVVIDTKKID